MEKFLYLTGSKGSGKNLIRGLLDGHPQLFVSAFHERIFEAFCEDDVNVSNKKDIEQIRVALASKGHYFQLERHSWFKKHAYHIASDVFKFIDKNFDYYSFDKSWVEDLYRKGTKWTSQEVCRAIYRSFSQQVSSPFLKKVSKKKYYCALSEGYSNAIPRFIKTFPNSKIIYMKRDPIEIVAALVGRKSSPTDSYSGWFTRDALFKTWATHDFIRLLVKLDNQAETAMKKYPDQVMIVKFSNFFDNLKKETARIRKFLKISDDISLKHYSIAGHNIFDSDGNSFLTKRVDYGYGNLSKTEIKKLKSYLGKVRK